MKKTADDWETHLDNRIPITRDDTRRRSIARTLHEAAEHAKVDENAVQGNQGRRAGTGMVRGRKTKKGGEAYIAPTKKENRWTVAAVQRRVAFRKTQTPSANSLTEGPPKRK